MFDLKEKELETLAINFYIGFKLVLNSGFTDYEDEDYTLYLKCERIYKNKKEREKKYGHNNI